jgi:hypothetical protein
MRSHIQRYRLVIGRTVMLIPLFCLFFAVVLKFFSVMLMSEWTLMHQAFVTGLIWLGILAMGWLSALFFAPDQVLLSWQQKEGLLSSSLQALRSKFATQVDLLVLILLLSSSGMFASVVLVKMNPRMGMELLLAISSTAVFMFARDMTNQVLRYHQVELRRQGIK